VRAEVHTVYWLGNLRDRDNMEDPGIDSKVILREIFRKWEGWAWAALTMLRVGTVGGH